jgi:hypothetical protein
MKTQTVLNAINNDKQLLKAINQNSYYSPEQFISDAKRYLLAIKKGIMINSIGSVSSSGMSRTIKFLAPEYNKYSKRYQYCNFYAFFKALGFNEARGKEHYFSIGGCGMDMIFHTNYTIIHKLHRLGFITKKQCDFLAQQTPQTI